MPTLDAADIARMYSETVNKLDSLSRSVREGKNVPEAANFAKFLQFSGYLKIFDLNPSSQKFFIVDPKEIRKRISDLIYDCGQWFNKTNTSPKYHASDIAEINAKLDQLIELAASPSGLGIEPTAPEPSRHSARRGRAKGPQAGQGVTPPGLIN